MSDKTTETDASTSSTTKTSTTKDTATTTDSGLETTTITTSATRTVVTAASTPTYLLGPLTTTFTAPTQCSQAYWEYDTSAVYDPILGQTCASVDDQISGTLNSNCLPPVTKSTIVGSLVGSSTILSTSYQYTGYYSPGIACPAGYSTACAAQAGSNGIQSALSSVQSFDFIYSATADETVVGCCPTGYACQSILSTQWCQNIIPATTQALITCVNATNSVSTSTTHFTLPTVVTLSATDTLLSTMMTSKFNLTTLSLLATMVQINFQATDLPTFSSSSPSPSSSSTSSSDNTNSDWGSTNIDDDPHHEAIVGAIVASVTVAFIAALCGWCCWWKGWWTKTRRNETYQTAQSTPPDEEGMYQSPDPYRASAAPTEMSGDPARAEMSGAVAAWELPGSDPTTVAYEMDVSDAISPYRDDEGQDLSK